MTVTVIDAPFLFSEWVPVSPDGLDLSSRRDADHGRAKTLADAWAESLGEAPRLKSVELSHAAAHPAKTLAEAWERENR